MVIKQPGTEGTDHKIFPFKGKVHGWRLMHAAGDGLKLMYGKGKWVLASVPPHHVKRMMTIMDREYHPFLFDLNDKIALQVNSLQVFRGADIPFRIRGMFQ